MIKPLMKWLPQPKASDIDYSRNLSKEDIDVDGLMRLSHLDWDTSGLRRLARSVTRMRPSFAAGQFLGRFNLQPIRALIFCNATAQHLAETLVGTGIRHGMMLDTMIAEYEEPEVFLARNRESLAAFAPDIAIIATDVHAFALKPTLGDAAAADEAAERAVARLRVVREQLRAVLGTPVIFQTIIPDPEQSRLHVDRLIPGSHKDLVSRANTKIADFVRDSGDLILDVAAIAATVGFDNWASSRHWALAKYQFAPDMAPLYAEHLARLIGLRFGKSRRVLVLDLDNTLWGGIVGDDGKDNLVLGPGSPVGEAHRAIQQMAKSLRERGIVLCVSSKNEESVALDAFRTHPEMVLDEEHIAIFQINWKDKAANLLVLSQFLNLSLESFVFLDDNPAERAQVRFTLPEVAVPELPKDVTEWLGVFQAACYFETTGFTQEDRERGGYYRANAMRAAQLQSSAGQADYLRSLDMEMEIASFDAAGRKRIAQLMTKSNQFNLTTKRYSEADVAAAEVDPTRIALQIRLSDIFGDNGMISVVIADLGQNSLDIETWLMSCRVLGRGVPEAVLDWLVGKARRLGKPFIRGTYIPTKKNMMVADHYRGLGFSLMDQKPDATTYWQLSVASYGDKRPPIRIRDRVIED
jgi:FkbH-like protein